jgi:integrase
MREKTKCPGVWLVRGARGIKYRAYCAVQVPDPASPAGVKWKWINKTFSKYADAVAFKNKTATEVRAGKYVEPSELSVRQVIENWLSAGESTGVSKHGRWKKQTYLGFKGQLKTHIGPALGDYAAAKLKKRMIESAGARWQSDGLSAQSVNKLYATMNAAFKWALKDPDSGIVSNPMEQVVRAVTAIEPEQIEREQLGIEDIGEDEPEAKTGVLRAVTEDEVYNPRELNKLFHAAHDGYERCFVMTGGLCGLRHGEIDGLRWAVVHWKKSKLVINRSLTQLPQSEGGPRLERPKSRKGYRALDMSKQLLSELRKWQLKCPPNPNGLVFVDELGRPATRKNNNRMLREIAARAGVKPLTVLGLRHTFASIHLTVKGTDKFEVSEMMGHSDYNVTFRVYAHFIKQQKKSNSQNDFADLIFQSTDDAEEAETA